MTEKQPQEGNRNIGTLINRLYEIREEMAELAKTEKVLRDEREVLKAQLIESYDSMGMTHSRTDKASATLTKTQVPVVKDWDALNEYILLNDALYLLQRRVNSAAYRELSDQGEELPGVSSFEKIDISIRKG